MFNSSKFKINDTNELLAFVKKYPFSTLINVHQNKPLISHLPMSIRFDENSIILIGHMSRANLHWRTLTNSKITAIFNGPHAYITPKWYVSNDVPTWNYAVAHIEGSAELIQEEKKIIEHLKILSADAEKLWPSGWNFFIPNDLLNGRLVKAIVGFKITVDTFELKKKLSQNRSPLDINGIFQGLSQRDDSNSKAILEEMRKNSP